MLIIVSILLGIVLTGVLATTIAEETLALQARRIASIFRPKEYESPPNWSGEKETPLFTFAWVSDFHLNGRNRTLATKALDQIETELRPDFVLVTGDNCAFSGEAGFQKPNESKALARQRFFKSFLDEHLNRPYYVIPGDNWPFEFDKIFGPKQYSFDYGGVHFAFLSADRACKGMKLEGLAILDDETLDWFRSDLETHEDLATLVIMHESFYPPTFLDTDRIEAILDATPSVLACLHGHLHVDMEVEKNGRRYLLCPSIGRTNPAGMKLASVYSDRIVFRTLEYDADGSEFRFTKKWQQVPIPQQFRVSLKKPSSADGKGLNFSEVPPKPFVSDMCLSKRFPELLGKLQTFVFRDWPTRVDDGVVGTEKK